MSAARTRFPQPCLERIKGSCRDGLVRIAVRLKQLTQIQRGHRPLSTLREYTACWKRCDPKGRSLLCVVKQTDSPRRLTLCHNIVESADESVGFFVKGLRQTHDNIALESQRGH